MEERSFIKPAVSFALLMAGVIMTAAGAEWFTAEWVRIIWYAAAFLPVGAGVIREAAEEAAKGDVFSEFMLMSVASVGAFLIGEFPEGVAVMLFYCIGETLQDMAVDRARDNIKSLMEFRPDHAMVINGGETVRKDPAEVEIGDFIEVRPGERVPLDGILTSGTAAFNTAALTGESLPREIESGQEVLAGMTATDTTVRLRVTRKAEDSAVARILRMVEDASERKAPAELFIRRFARIYTPVVIGLAAMAVLLPWLWSAVTPSYSFDFSTSFYHALIFLVISCPCALVISVPLSYFAGIGAASTQGVLFKGGNWLDAITLVDTIAFDKTGTLTTGEFSVVRTDEMGRKGLLNIVAALEKDLSHPIAKAIVRAAGDIRVEVKDVRNLPGRGVQGVRINDAHECAGPRMECAESVQAYNGSVQKVCKDAHECANALVECAESVQVGTESVQKVCKDNAHQCAWGTQGEREGDLWAAGTLRLLDEMGVSYPAELKEMPGTIVACACNGEYAGYLLLADTPKKDAAQAVKNLRSAGVENIVILSGDRQTIVNKVASELQTDGGYGELMPEGKVQKIEMMKQQGHRVAFVGDGINDAPVLAASDVGIAMGAMGSDMAVETADIVLQDDSPAKVAVAIRTGRKTRAIVRQNIVFAIGVKVLVMVLGLAGLASLWAAVFADVGVAVLAVLNAMRIFIGRNRTAVVKE